MPRLRSAFRAMSVLSAGVCVVGAVLWLTSSFRHDVLFVEEKWVSGGFYTTERTELHSVRGVLYLTRTERAVLPRGDYEDHLETVESLPLEALRSGGLRWTAEQSRGLRWRPGERTEPWGGPADSVGREGRRGIASISYRTWTFACAVLPIYWGLRKLRHVLEDKPGHCPRCGYDLTGNRSGICPECGANVKGVAV